NDDRAQQPGGTYECWPSEERITRDLDIERRTFYRGLANLRDCSFYLVTVEARGRSNHYVLHIRPEDLKPEAILQREQAHDAHLKSGRKQKRDRVEVRLSRLEDTCQFGSSTAQNCHPNTGQFCDDALQNCHPEQKELEIRTEEESSSARSARPADP